jgi:O-antigen/teichoic acid export membrane protein
MKENSIKRNAFFNVVYTIVNMVFPLITYPYVTRVLSAVGMGKVSFFSSVSNYAIMFGSLGISTYGIRAVAKVRDDEKELSKVTSELFWLNIIITVIVIFFL